MNFFEKLSRGWRISLNSFKVLRENKQLIIFPILSGVSMILVTASFLVAVFAAIGGNADNLPEDSSPLLYAAGFLFYLINYFVIIFFNSALIHCSTLYFRGERPTVAAGLAFSKSRLGSILLWSVFAATVGFLLRNLQERLGWAGKLITALVGAVWNVATFFAVPIMIYENTNPLQTVKRSARLIKEKWGEGLGASFSFAIIYILGIFIVGGTLLAVGLLINPVVGMALAAVGILAVIAILSASETIFISAMYNNVTGDPVKQFDEQFADRLFVSK